MKTWSSLLVGFWLSSLIALPTNAQISIDGTTNTQLTPIDNGVRIDEGDRAGGNLFHSFDQFSILNGSEAFFNNANDIVNIFSRVTGGNISTIDGLLRANGTANLFLINPAGIILGQNARLDIGGSFLGSTADSILFEDGSEFIATDGQNQPILTINAPIGLGFRDNPAEINVEGTGNGERLFDSEVIDTQEALRVDADATIGLVGGKLRFEDATIKTAGGRIELGSVAGGQVNLRSVDKGWSFDYSAVENFNDISLSGRSNIDASGLGGGEIQVAGQNITLRDISAFEANILGGEAGGDINIFAAESLEISGVENELNFVSGIGSRVFPNGNADGGDITIETGNLRLGERAFIATSSFGQGNAGDITIKASNSLTLESQGNSSMIASSIVSGAIGNAGDINITTPSLTLSNGGAFLDSSSLGEGNAGNINISSNSLTLNSGADLFAANIGQGNGGNVTINATDFITLEGEDADNPTGIFTFISENNTIGDAGNIELNTGSITLSNEADLFAFNSSLGEGGDVIINAINDVSLNNDSDIFVNGTPGGSINITAKNLSLISDSAFFAGISVDSGFADAQSGNIVINLSEDLVLDGLDAESSASINNSNFGTGNAGSIEISARNITLKNGGTISSFNTGEGDIGSITLSATEAIWFDGRSGIANFVVEEGTGNIGEINLTAENLTLTNGSEIASAVSGTANSGDINLNISDTIRVDGFAEFISEDGTQSVLPSGITSNINSSGTGNSGNININTQNLFLSRNGELSNSVFGQGNAGNININANLITIGEQGNTTISPSNISSEAISEFLANPLLEANGGNITLNTGSLFISDGGSVDVGINAIGNSGNITIKATDTLSIDGTATLNDIEVRSGIFSSNSPDTIGNAGSIEINAANFSLTNDAILTTSSSGQGNAGNITVEVTDNFTASSSLITSNIGAPQGTPAAGKVGSIFITARNIFFSDTAQIQAGAFSGGTVEQPGIISLTATESISFNATNTGIFSNNDPGSFGDASDTQLSASNITLNDGAGIISGNESNGQGGNITLSTEQLTLNNGSRITAGVLGAGDAGSITIDTGKLTVRDGSQIGAGTNGQGNAGNLTISATELIELRGTTDTGISGLFANALIEDGNGGNLEIFTKDLIVSDGAIISVSNFPSVEGLVEPGTGEAGNLTIEANSLRLENRGRIDAATQAGNGGNIALQIADEITLRDNSLISARALKDANGGNITIDTKFIIASPNQNNDIIASASQGIGGNIKITAEGVFGLEERSSTPTNETNDIDASSEFGLDGSVSINTPDVGTFSETIEAPQIVQLQTLGIDACSSSRGLGVSSLEVTGQGGIPPQLTAPMGSESIFLEGKYTPMGKGQSERVQTEQIKPLVTAQGQIYPARGIVFLENGDIILTAYPTDNVQRIPHSSANCRKS